MDKRKKDHSCRYGRLPASAPLANPYVPFQAEDPQKYDTRKALIRGTLFPGLDLPFMGSVNRRLKAATPMTELQALAFAVQELALYLDTHCDDRQALALYRDYQRLYEQCRMQHRKHLGQLNHQQISESAHYDWLCDPWPWEYSKNKEV